MFTVEILKASIEFKSLVKDEVSLIHNVYGNDSYPIFIVISVKDNKYTITRFWQSPNRKDQLDKIHVSVDHVNLLSVDVFKLLLSEYSNPLQ